jgi:hypothetical protein
VRGACLTSCMMVSADSSGDPCRLGSRRPPR